MASGLNNGRSKAGVVNMSTPPKAGYFDESLLLSCSSTVRCHNMLIQSNCCHISFSLQCQNNAREQNKCLKKLQTPEST